MVSEYEVLNVFFSYESHVSKESDRRNLPSRSMVTLTSTALNLVTPSMIFLINVASLLPGEVKPITTTGTQMSNSTAKTQSSDAQWLSTISTETLLGAVLSTMVAHHAVTGTAHHQERKLRSPRINADTHTD